VRLASVQPRDIVLVSKGGRRFHAHVRGIRDGVVEFTPIERGISYRHASAREVLEVWHRRRPRRDPGDEELHPQSTVSKAQLSLAGRFDRPAAAQG
jgi:hypothetical protein